MPNKNDPYSRPINATRLEGQMLQGEFYGDKASDKALHQATGGRAVHQVRPMASVVPTWPDAKPTPPTTPSPDVTSPSDEQSPPKKRVKATIDDIAPLDEILAEEAAITEDDLFG